MGIINDQIKGGGPQTMDTAPARIGKSAPDSKKKPDDETIDPEQSTSSAESQNDEVSPQEQQAYDKVIGAAIEVITNESTHAGIMQMLQSGAADPAKAIADVTAMIVTKLDEKSKGTIPEAVIAPAAAEIMGIVAQLGERAGFFKVDEALQGKAAQLLLMELAEQYGVDPAEIQGLIDEIGPDQAREMASQQVMYAGGGQPAGTTQPGAPAPMPEEEEEIA